MDNLDEMDKFPETFSLPKLNQEESGTLNIQIRLIKLKQYSKYSQQTKVLDWMALLVNLPNIQRRTNACPFQTIPKLS